MTDVFPRVALVMVLTAVGAVASSRALHTIDNPIAIGATLTAVGTFGVAMPVCSFLLAFGDDL